MISSYYALQKNTNRFLYFVIISENVKRDYVRVTHKVKYAHTLQSDKFSLRILK